MWSGSACGDSSSILLLRSSGRYSNRTAIQVLFAALFNYLREHDVTTLLTRESGVIVGPDLTLGASPVAIFTDTLVSLRTNTVRNRQYRTVAVLKMRHSAFDSTLHELRVGDGIVYVRPMDESDAAVLDGLATLNTQVMQ